MGGNRGRSRSMEGQGIARSGSGSDGRCEAGREQVAREETRKTRLALVVPLAVSCLIVLGLMALLKNDGKQPSPWWTYKTEAAAS